MGTFVTLTGKVTDVEMYACQGTVPCVAVMVPDIGKVTDVEICV
jgi:hypothetical protein